MTLEVIEEAAAEAEQQEMVQMEETAAAETLEQVTHLQ
jgi:hypothetical protein